MCSMRFESGDWLGQLYEQIKEIWTGMPHRVLNHLVENMSRRCAAVIKNQATALIIDAVVSASRGEFARDGNARLCNAHPD